MKAPHFLLYLHKTWSKLSPHEVIILTKFHEDRAKIEKSLVIHSKVWDVRQFFYSLNLSLGNFLSKFKGKIKDVSFTPKGLTPPSPNVSFLGYPPPSPFGETSFMDGPLESVCPTSAFFYHQNFKEF